RYRRVTEGDELWNALEVPRGGKYAWDSQSTYIRKPDFFTPGKDIDGQTSCLSLHNARILGLFGDSITTDHISPAGTIPGDYPAGLYLKSLGVEPRDFNSYGSRRGNHEVMMRGTFGNIRLKNLLAGGQIGGYTVKYPEGSVSFIYDAAVAYMAEGTPLVILAGKEYGTGSSRDWAAKGTRMLGVRAVIAESFERIHRSNLAGMGILPVTFTGGNNAESLGIRGDEVIDLEYAQGLVPGAELRFRAVRPDGSSFVFTGELKIFSETEADYLRQGGVLPYVLNALKE
ncbi:MAG: aconitate hydratase, partial [Spirochaetales bacterium]|nr:aconitate hydratase [Spirochaetales bacterium]